MPTITHVMSDETGQEILEQLIAIHAALDSGALSNSQISTVLNDSTPTGRGFLDGGGLKSFFDGLKTKFAAITHQHAASDITSGQLAIANGGTGASTAALARSNLDAAQSENAAGSLYDTEQALADLSADVAALGESVSPLVDGNGWVKSGDYNNFVSPGVFSVENGSIGNQPSNYNSTVLVLTPSTDRVLQLAIANSTGKVHVRHKLGSNWTAWVEL